MKVEILQEEMSQALSICSRFASNRMQLPILANILLEASKNKLHISSTNLELSVNMSISARVESEGSITVPSKIITETVLNLDKGQMSVSVDREVVTIKNPNHSAKISGVNSSDFPSIPSVVGTKVIDFTDKQFKESVSKVLFSASSDETRPVLTGVLMIIKESETLFVATDGFRLSQVILSKKSNIGDDAVRLIIPKNSLTEVNRLPFENLDFSYKKSENMVLFGFSNTVLSSRVIEGEFPDFEKIIPKESKVKFELDKEEFLRNIKLASIFAKDSANVVKLKIKKDGIEILSESQQYGSQKGSLDAKVDGEVGEKFVIAFNYRFLEDYVGSVEGDVFSVELSDPNSPALFIDPKVNNYLHIIMPIRLQE